MENYWCFIAHCTGMERRIYATVADQVVTATQEDDEWTVETALHGNYPSAVAGDPEEPAVAFCGTAEEGLWWTTDGGETWSSIGEEIPHERITAVSVDGGGMNPFGRAMARSLNDVRFDPETGAALWVEEDYCTPPLAMEREVLDRYFDDLVVVEEDVNEMNGWERIGECPSLWDEIAGKARAPLADGQ